LHAFDIEIEIKIAHHNDWMIASFYEVDDAL
jgi:hypothetical protein